MLFSDFNDFYDSIVSFLFLGLMKLVALHEPHIPVMVGTVYRTAGGAQIESCAQYCGSWAWWNKLLLVGIGALFPHSSLSEKFKLTTPSRTSEEAKEDAFSQIQRISVEL